MRDGVITLVLPKVVHKTLRVDTPNDRPIELQREDTGDEILLRETAARLRLGCA